ncbi:MAG: HlyD family type I secretion periplasmic adaptor subunit [Litorimonas sp.]
MTQKTVSIRPVKDKIVWKMGVVCLIGFGGFLAWGSIAPLEEGVAASGQIIVEDNRQVVQHLEGGIVSEIKVREGQFVEKGDVLVVLQKTASLSNRDQVVQEYGALAASVARLRALQTGASAPSFDALDNLDLGKEERADIIRRETGLFHQQRSALSADIAVLSARLNAAQQTQISREKQVVIAEKALESARDELGVIADMFSQQLARRDQVSASERLVATLEGDIANLNSQADDASASELDFKAQIAQAKAQAARDNATNLLSTSAELLAVEERLNAAQDVLDRSIIFAPVSGEVLNMAFSTIGGVVRSGETLMEIVPNIGEVTASVQIAATDRSAIFEGQLVRTQFSSYKGWQAPRLEGEIIDVSADLKTDPVTSVSYYEARIRVPASELARTTNVEVIPGMPVDAFIYSGKSRTLMDYLLEPLGESLFRGLRTS